MGEVTFHANGDVSSTDDYCEKRIAELEAAVDRLQGALRQIRNSLGAYRYYEVSVYLEDADNVAKLALDSRDTAGGRDE